MLLKIEFYFFAEPIGRSAPQSLIGAFTTPCPNPVRSIEPLLHPSLEKLMLSHLSFEPLIRPFPGSAYRLVRMGKLQGRYLGSMFGFIVLMR